MTSIPEYCVSHETVDAIFSPVCFYIEQFYPSFAMPNLRALSPLFLPITRKRIDGGMQTASSRIGTHVTVPISNADNHYTTSASYVFINFNRACHQKHEAQIEDETHYNGDVGTFLLTITSFIMLIYIYIYIYIYIRKDTWEHHQWRSWVCLSFENFCVLIW